MDVGRTEKKLREAQFFLDKMREQEKRASGDKEPFDFYLSAFLAAARSADYKLCHEQGAIYPSWRKAWDSGLQDSERKLIKFLVDDRNAEVHAGGSTRTETKKATPIGDSHADPSGNVVVFSPPSPFVAAVEQPSYWFTIDGPARKATEACAEYLSLLDRMVEKFKADNP